MNDDQKITSHIRSYTHFFANVWVGCNRRRKPRIVQFQVRRIELLPYWMRRRVTQ